jgi:hypothetical protein
MTMAGYYPPLDGDAFWSTIARNRQASITWISLPNLQPVHIHLSEKEKLSWASKKMMFTWNLLKK